MRAASYELAELLGAVVDGGYVLVPLPTIRRHIRERGFDHIDLVCRKMKHVVSHVLYRRNNTVQVGASAEERQAQAREAYTATIIDPERHYLLVDDVWTTGSSMMAACEVMRRMGAKNLAIAVIARS